jgi:hypothetical protein
MFGEAVARSLTARSLDNLGTQWFRGTMCSRRVRWSGRLCVSAGLILATSLSLAAMAQDVPASVDDNQPTTADDNADLNDIAWRGYHDAFRLLLLGQREDALAILSLLLQRYPTHPAVPLATQVVRLLDTGKKGEIADAASVSQAPDGDPAVPAPWRSYHAVFVALAQGLAPAEARARLGQVIVRWPGSAAAKRSQSLVAIASPTPHPNSIQKMPPNESVRPFGPNQEVPTSLWYGGTLVAADAITLGITGLGRLLKSNGGMALGLALNVTDGLVVHTYAYPLSRRGTGMGKGFLSLLLRGGLAIGLCATSSGCFGQTISDGALVRMVAGLVIADAIDSTFLARKRLEPDERAGLEVEPLAFATPQGGQMGLVARW